MGNFAENLNLGNRVRSPLHFDWIPSKGNRGIAGKFFWGGKDSFSDIFPGVKYFFPVQNVHFGRPKTTNFSGFEKWEAKKKKERKREGEKKGFSSFCNFSTFHFQFYTFPFTIYRLFFSIFSPFPFFSLASPLSPLSPITPLKWNLPAVVYIFTHWFMISLYDQTRNLVAIFWR